MRRAGLSTIVHKADNSKGRWRWRCIWWALNHVVRCKGCQVCQEPDSCLQPGYPRQTCAVCNLLYCATDHLVQMYYMCTTTVCIWKAFSIVTDDWRYCCTANTKMHDIVWLLVHSMNVLLSPASRVQITISFNFKTSCAVQTLLCSVHGVLCSVQCSTVQWSRPNLSDQHIKRANAVWSQNTPMLLHRTRSL